MVTRPPLLFLDLLLLAAPIGAAEEPSFKVVVNASSSVTSTTRQNLSRMFLKKLTRWENGETVTAVDQPSSSPIRVEFTRAVHRRKVSAIESYWRQQIFAGRNVAVLVQNNDLEVLSFVRLHPGAVGYVAVDAEPPSQVKSIAIVE